MGYMRHHGILVTGGDWCKLKISVAHAKAVELFKVDGHGMVTALMECPINGYSTFAVIPDGSKEGWPESNHGDKLRAEFIAWMEREGRYDDGGSSLDWVEVQYGDDERETKITAHNDEPERRKERVES